jgi:hypothetical protein
MASPKYSKRSLLSVALSLIERCDKFKEYNYDNCLKPSILYKIKLNDDIKVIDIKIKEVNNKIITSSCINGYNKENVDSYNELCIILTDIDNVIAILELFGLLNLYAELKNHNAAIIYKILVFFLIEKHDNSTIREFMLRNFCLLFENF